MRDHTKAIEAVQEAREHDTEHKHTAEINQQEIKCQQALFTQQASETQEETLQRAMRDPEVAVSPRRFVSAPLLSDSHLLLGYHE